MPSTALSFRRETLSRWFPCTTGVCRSVVPRLRWWHGPVAILAFIALWQIENFRGDQRWETAVALLDRHGIASDWREYVDQRPVAPEDNIAAHPFFADVRREVMYDPQEHIHGYFVDPDQPIRAILQGLPHDILTGKVGDLEVWAATLDPEGTGPAPARVLQATAHLDAPIDQLHDALQRPFCQWVELDLAKAPYVPVPAISSMTIPCKRLASLLYTRALAFLEKGQPAEASRQLETAVKFRKVYPSRHITLVSAWEWINMDRAAGADVHRLVFHEAWDEESLAFVQEVVGQNALLGPLDQAFKTEVASSMGFWSTVRDGERWALNFMGVGSIIGEESWINTVRTRLTEKLPKVMPRGWHHQNMARLAEAWDRKVLSIYDAKLNRISRTGGLSGDDLAGAVWTPYNFLAKIGLSYDAVGFYKSAAEVQTRWDLLEVLCALQRYRLAHSEYPENLPALETGGFINELPQDYVKGRSPFYVRTSAGFALASLDWERRSDPEGYLCRIESP